MNDRYLLIRISLRLTGSVISYLSHPFFSPLLAIRDRRLILRKETTIKACTINCTLAVKIMSIPIKASKTINILILLTVL
jgi:hypothetical protein